MTGIIIPLETKGKIKLSAGTAMPLTVEKVPVQITSLIHNDLIIRGSGKNITENFYNATLKFLVKFERNHIGTLEQEIPYPDTIKCKKTGTNSFKIVPDQTSEAFALDMIKLGLLGKGRLGYEIDIDQISKPHLIVKPDESGISFNIPCGVSFVNAETNAPLTPDSSVQIGTVIKIVPEISNLFSGKTVDLIISESDDNEQGNSGVPYSHVIEFPVGNVNVTDPQLWQVGSATTEGDAVLCYGNQWETDKIFEFTYELKLTNGPIAQPDPNLPEIVENGFLFKAALPELKKFDISLKDAVLSVQIITEGFSPKIQIPVDLKLYGLIFDKSSGHTTVKQLDELIYDHLTPEISDPGTIPSADLRITITNNSFNGEIVQLSTLHPDILNSLQNTALQEINIFGAISIPSIIDGGKPVFATIMHYPPNYTDTALYQTKGGFAPFRNGAFSTEVEATEVCSANAVNFSGIQSELESDAFGVPPEKQEEFDLLVATVCGESIGSSERAWKAVTFSIMNRVKRHKWAEHNSVTAIIQNSGYDAYKQKTAEFKNAQEYLKKRTAAQKSGNTTFSPDQKYEKVINAIVPVYLGRDPDFTEDTLWYYSPRAQAALHNQNPSVYPSKPAWDWNFYHEVTSIVIPSPGQTDDFKFYTRKIVMENPRWSHEDSSVMSQIARLGENIVLEADIRPRPEYVNLFNTDNNFTFQIVDHANNTWQYYNPDSKSKSEGRIRAVWTIQNLKRTSPKPVFQFRAFHQNLGYSEWCQIPFDMTHV